MSKYELLYILRNNLSEEQKTNAIESIDAMIKARGAELEKTDNLGNKKFAYEINKTREGTYVLTNFSAETNVVAEVNRQLNLDEKVVRSMIIMKK